jgi:hypothetical protein
MRAALLIAGVLTIGAGAAVGGGAQPQPAQPSDDVAAWFDALDRHAPGVNDAAIRTILWIRPRSFARVKDRLIERRRVEGVESFNRLVHRGALMHLDAAMLAANSGPLNGGRTIGSSRPRQRAILTTDGGYSGVDTVSEHWDWGRQLVALTMPRPDEDRWALLWYVVSSSFMANRSLLADLQPHLEQARKVFPTDPDILYVSGCYFDMVASPRVRPMLDARTLPFGLRVDAPSARESLRSAEDYFRRAAEARPGFAAAHVRRGRALDRLGRHDEAVQELQAVASVELEPAMMYLVNLFEADAQDALGNLSAAQALYEQAARRFPQAQAPYLALSRLARDRGDRAAALAAAEHVFTRRSGDEMADPWWTYYLLVVRDAPAQLHALQQPFQRAAAPAVKD